MPDLPIRTNSQPETLAGDVHDDGKSALVEPHRPTIAVKTVRGTAGQHLRLLKYGKHEVVFPS